MQITKDKILSLCQFNVAYDFLALLSGALLTLSFAPFNFYWLAIVCPALLLCSITDGGLKRSALRGGLFGLGFFGTGASWVFVSIHVYGPSPIPLALVLTTLFVIVLATYYALLTLVFKKIFRVASLSSYLLAFPALWVIFEALRGYLFTGFPWLLLGYSQTDSPFTFLLPLIGTYGASFILVLMAGSIAFAMQKRKDFYMFLLPAILLSFFLSIGLFVNSFQWTSEKNDPLEVSLIQGNIPQSHKWDPEFIHQIMTRYQDLTNQEWHSDIIVWPEAAVPIPLPYANNWLLKLAKQAREHDAILIVGALSEDDNKNYHNGMLALGQSNDFYEKRKLVPFGEFVPFESLLRGLINFFDLPMSHMEAGDSNVSNILHTDFLEVLPLICYEVAYVNLLDEAKDSDIVVTISNDAWFGRSIGPSQHLQIAQVRALETGRYVLRATNSGITAIIAPNGKVIAQLPQFVVSVLHGKVVAMTGATPFLKIGYWKILFLITLALVVSLLLAFPYKRKKTDESLVIVVE